MDLGMLMRAQMWKTSCWVVKIGKVVPRLVNRGQWTVVVWKVENGMWWQIQCGSLRWFNTLISALPNSPTPQ